METREIEKFLNKIKKIKKYFKGVHPSNHLNNIKLKKYEFIVINTCEYPQIINLCHWVLCVNIGKSLYFFDSAGQASFKENKNIHKFLKSHNKRIYHNKLNIQHIFSVKCGEFVCIFAYLFYQNKKIPKLTDIFYLNNLKRNDKIVDKIFKFVEKENK